MQPQFNSILPKLMGATLLVGLATFVMGTLFKLLLGITLIGGVVTLVGKKLAGRQQYLQNGTNYTNMPMLGNGPIAIQPVRATAPKGSTIVPIN